MEGQSCKRRVGTTDREMIHIIEKDDQLYVARPTSWTAGWARQLFLERNLKRKVIIASPDFWEELKKTGKHIIVHKDKDGKQSICLEVAMRNL